MIRPQQLLLPVLALLLSGCSSEDPRVPRQLYDEAVQMMNQNRHLEAKSLLELLANRYPQTPEATKARKDLYTVEGLYGMQLREQQATLRKTMRRTADALTRYKGKQGEYPVSLQQLVPEYLEEVPETAWGHPFFYRPFVSIPIENLKDKRGSLTQRMNTKLDRYFLVCLGTDLQPGGTDMAQDIFIVDGEFYGEPRLPEVPLPQPVR